MDDQTNRLVNNRYRLLRLLGEGGMAQVWLAQDESLERQVALKRLRPLFAQDAKLLARFRREAQIVARLNSPYIVQIYDVGVNEQDSFIVMEYVDGQDLKKLLNLKAPLSADETLELMRALTTGVATAHEAGLIHRDLKPANILISKRGQIKISDFGIARDLTKAGMTQPGTIWGTSDYMAPEQAMGEPPAPTMDVYSLGVMMFEMLSGQRPYTGRDATAVMMAHINKPVPSLRRIMPTAPEKLSRLVLRLMSKNPASRPPDAGALLKILNHYGGSIKTSILHPVVKPKEAPDELVTRQLEPEEAPPTRHWGTGNAASSLEKAEGPTRHWAKTPPPATNPPSSADRSQTRPPFMKDQSEAATRHADSVPAKENNRMLMMGGGVTIVLLLLCLFIGLANGGLNAIIGGDSATSTPSQVANAPVTETVVEPTLTPTPTEEPSTATAEPEPEPEPATATATPEPEPAIEEPATPTEPPATATATTVPATSTATTEPPTETPTVAVEPSATATITIEPILSSVTPPPTIDPYPYPAPEAKATPASLLGAREGNAPDAYVWRTSSGINLDGNLTEWDLTQSVDIQQPVTDVNRWRGLGDLSGTAYFAWDDTYFYMAIRRIDNEHLQTRTGYELYRDDSVELWLDFDVYGDLDEPQANADDYQFVFSAGDFDTLRPEGVTYYPNRGNYQLAVGAAPLGKSYRLEARIPWAAVGVTPFDGMELGYAVVLNDNDSPQEQDPKSQVSSNRIVPFKNPSAFGNMFLRP